MAIAEARQGRLPTPATTLIGRRSDLEDVTDLVLAHRLVTLTGSGGSGKTRLAIAAAGTLEPRFRDGVTFVRLHEARSREDLGRGIAVALGLIDDVGTDLERDIVDRLETRELLLVLDNFEQIVSAAPLVADLLGAAPKLRVVATSRAPLRIAGEQEREVLPLAESAATDLFIERARAVRPDFDSSRHQQVITAIAARVDNLPLALELAAARVRLLTPEAILERLEARLPVLEGGTRDAPARQRTQTATLDWSYELLDEPTRRLFAELSVFAGGWTLTAAEHVSDPTDDEGSAILDRSASLVEHSLVRVVDLGEQEPRYRMHQLTREYAAEHLDASGERAAVERRHALWVAALVEEAAPHLDRRGLQTWQARLRAEDANIRAALRWAIEHGEAELGMRIAGSLWRYWYSWARSREGVGWLEAILELPGAEVRGESRARALSSLGALYWHQGRGAESFACYEEEVDLRRELGDDLLLGDALDNLSWAAVEMDDPALTMRYAEEKWEHERDRSTMDGWLGRDASLALRSSSFTHREAEMAAAIEAIIKPLERSEYALLAVYAMSGAAQVNLWAGRYERARSYVRRSIRGYIELGHLGQLVISCRTLAACELELGHPERAVRLEAAVTREIDELGGIVGVHGGPIGRNGDILGRARGLLSPERFARCVADGRAMTLEEATTLALSRIDSRGSVARPAPRHPDDLTPREREVLALVADGLDDAAIASELVISPKTASVHVSSIKAKLHARNRAHIATIAHRRGLVEMTAPDA